MKDSICIMGGTFNPIHNGHLKLAIQAHEQFALDDILIMPSGTPAHKDNKGLISPQHRCNMVRAAISDYPFMRLSMMEIERGGNTYTSDTLYELKQQNPQSRIYFIIGADSLFALPKWHEPEYVMSNCILLTANRDSYKQEELIRQKCFLEERFNAGIRFLDTPMLPYSSTDIRKNVAEHKSIEGMVPKAVEEYIYNNNLYG